MKNWQTGVKQAIPTDSPQVHNRRIEDPGRGKHLWIMLVMYQLMDPAQSMDPAAEMHLDRENLLTIEGPGCYKCEKHWTADIGRRFCQGVMP